METLYLSRRNLLVLLSKLDRNSAGDANSCSIIKQDNVHPTYPASMDSITVVAIEDEDYYTERIAGTMNPLDTINCYTRKIN